MIDPPTWQCASITPDTPGFLSPSPGGTGDGGAEGLGGVVKAPVIQSSLFILQMGTLRPSEPTRSHLAQERNNDVLSDVFELQRRFSSTDIY